jgi:hypothetical protein
LSTLSPAQRLERHLDALPAALVGSRALARLRAAAEVLPPFSAGIALECHLDPEAGGRVDLISRLTPIERSAVLSGARGSLESRDVAFLQRWADEADPLHSMPHVDLEVDVTGDSGIRLPFSCPTVEPRFPAGVRAIRAARSDSRRMAKMAVEALSGKPMADDLWAALERVYDALPPGGFIHYAQPLWIRTGSPLEAVRVILSIPRRGATTTLEQAGWSGSLEQFESRCDRWSPHARRLGIDLDVGPAGPGPRVALYGAFAFPDPRDLELRTMLEFAAAEREGLDEPIQALLDHCEAVRRASVHDARAVQLKLYWDEDPQLRLKAYLSFLD